MKSQIKIILAGFNSNFSSGLENLFKDNPEWEVTHTFGSKEELEQYISQGGTADVILFDDRLTDITFVPKHKKIKIYAFTSTPEKFKYDNWFYVGITGTLDWGISKENLYTSLSHAFHLQEENPLMNNSF